MPGRISLRVRVHPGAKKDEAAGFRNGVLLVRLRAPAIEGRANEALVAFIAKLLKCSKSQVALKKGERSRDKVLEIMGVGEEAIRDLHYLLISGEEAS